MPAASPMAMQVDMMRAGPSAWPSAATQRPAIPGEKNYETGISFFDYLSMCAAIPEEKKAACWTFMEWLATEGNAWMASVAHIPSWKQVDKQVVVDKLLVFLLGGLTNQLQASCQMTAGGLFFVFAVRYNRGAQRAQGG